MLFYIVLCITFLSASAGNIPSYFPLCSIKSPEAKECIINATQTLRPYLEKGIPELNIPPIDPFHIPQLLVQHGTDAVNFKVTMKNTTIYGFSKYVFKDFTIDPKTLAITGEGYFDRLTVKSLYEMDGKILAINLRGSGNFEGILEKCAGILNVTGEIIEKGGVEYFKPKDFKSSVTVEDGRATFDSAFDGNAEILRTANEVVNEHSKELLKELQPAIEEIAEGIMKTIITGVAQNIPYKKLIGLD